MLFLETLIKHQYKKEKFHFSCLLLGFKNRLNYGHRNYFRIHKIQIVLMYKNKPLRDQKRKSNFFSIFFFIIFFSHSVI